jgi:hypothetical protein
MSGQLVLGAAGALVLGPAGFGLVSAGTGWLIGTTIGGLVNQPDGPGPGDLSGPQLQEGAIIPRLYGTTKATGQLAGGWISAIRATENDTGGKGGPPSGSAGYSHACDVVMVIGHRTSIPVIAITRVFINKKLVWTARADSPDSSIINSQSIDHFDSITLMPGGPSQVPPATYESAVGTVDAQAFRNVVAVAIDNLQLGSTKAIPLVEVETITQGAADTVDATIRLQTDGSLDDISAFAALNGDGTATGSGAGAIWDTGGTVGADSFNTWTSTALSNISGGVVSVEFCATITANGGLNSDIMQYRSNVSGGLYQIGIVETGVDGFYGVSLETPSGNTYSDNVIVDGAHTHFLMVIYAGSGGTALYVDGVLRITLASTNVGETPGTQGSLRVGTAGYTGPGQGAREFAIGDIRVGFAAFDTASVDCAFPPPDGALDVVTPAPADLQEIVDAERAMNPAITLADHDTSDLAGIDVNGFIAVGSPAKTINELAQIFYFDLVPGAPMRYETRGLATVATIPNADTGVGVDNPAKPFTGLMRGNDVEVPSVVGLRAPNFSADGDMTLQRSDRGTTDGPDVRRVETPVYLTPSECKGRAITMALMARASAHKAEFALSDKYARIEPGDACLVYSDDGSLHNLFARRLTYADGVKALTWEHNDSSAFVFSGITDVTYEPSLIVDLAVESNLVALDIPLLRDVDDGAGFYTAVEGEGTTAFPGGVVRRSIDNLDFSEIVTTHSTESVVGTVTTVLGDFTGGYVWDDYHTVTVTLGDGQTLSSATEAAMQLDRTLNAAALGAHGRWEIIRFRTATLVSPGVYTLSGLLRGVLGTEEHIDAHSIADAFVLLSTANLRRASMDAADIGLTRYLKAVTDGRSTASATSRTFVTQAVGLRMYSPTNLRAARDGSANITFTFDRRTRFTPRHGGTGGSYIPPQESGETYEIDIYTTSGYTSVVRTLTGATASIAYSAAQQTTDFGSAQSTVYARVYAVSTFVGRGAYLQAAA